MLILNPCPTHTHTHVECSHTTYVGPEVLIAPSLTSLEMSHVESNAVKYDVE